MGSEYQRDGKWVVSWKDASGRWREKRTSCKTKVEARRFREDLERQAERQGMGLEPLMNDRARATFGELMDWYWSRHGVKLRSTTIRFTLEKHLASLRPFALSAITTDRVDELLTRKRNEISAETHNKIRSKLHRMFELAKKPGVDLWWGPNPVAQVERRQPPKRLPTTLSADEVPALLGELHGQHLHVVATALFTAMRKGEVGGLLKSDVDLDRGVVRLQRCWDGAATKDGKPLLIPIARCLRPYLDAALSESRSRFLFPAPDGGMHRPDVKWDVTLRRALGRAGIVAGYEHRCRRKGCGYRQLLETADAGRCPKPRGVNGGTCGFRLYAKPIPRHVRFHDLRHTTATLLLQDGVPLAVVSKLLRHSDPKITLETYGHLDIEDLRDGVDRLAFGNGTDAANEPSDEPPEPDGAPVARTRVNRKSEGPVPVGNPSEHRAFVESGRQDLNLRPLAPQASALPGCATPRNLGRAIANTAAAGGQRRSSGEAGSPPHPRDERRYVRPLTQPSPPVGRGEKEKRRTAPCASPLAQPSPPGGEGRKRRTALQRCPVGLSPEPVNEPESEPESEPGCFGRGLGAGAFTGSVQPSSALAAGPLARWGRGEKR